MAPLRNNAPALMAHGQVCPIAEVHAAGLFMSMAGSPHKAGSVSVPARGTCVHDFGQTDAAKVL